MKKSEPFVDEPFVFQENYRTVRREINSVTETPLIFLMRHPIDTHASRIIQGDPSIIIHGAQTNSGRWIFRRTVRRWTIRWRTVRREFNSVIEIQLICLVRYPIGANASGIIHDNPSIILHGVRTISGRWILPMNRSLTNRSFWANRSSQKWIFAFLTH